MLGSLISFTSSVRTSVERVGRLMGYAAGWAFIAIAVLITFDVIARRFFGVSTQATTELSGYALAFGTTWGLAHTLAGRAHVRIDVVINRFSTRLRAWLHVLSLLLLGVLTAYLFYGAATLVEESILFGATDVSVVRTPLAIPQGLWAFGIGAFFLLIVLLSIEALLLIIARREREVDGLLQSRGYQEEVAEALEAVGGTVTAPNEIKP